MPRQTMLLVVVALTVVAGSPPGRTLVPEIIDMGVTGRRSSGPGPAGAGGEEALLDDGLARPHARLTLAITPAPSAFHYQHVQGGFVRSEPAGSRPQDEDALQAGLRRRKRDDQVAEASTPEDAREDARVDAEAAASGDDGDMFLEPDASVPSPTGQPGAESTSTTDATGQPQNLFPAFQPLFPLGHSRPPIFQEPAFGQRPGLLRSQFNPFQQHALGTLEAREPRLDVGHLGPHAFRERAYPPPAAPVAAPAELHAGSLLGSGNFGVIHGGTFYGEEKEAQDYDSPTAALHSFYGGNGHGRPSFYRGNPEPQRYRTSEDFFANFRDFADISTPTKSSFSEYYVVYVNRNASRADPGTVVGPEDHAVDQVDVRTPSRTSARVGAEPGPRRPNNIFERLAQIDREHAEQQVEAVPPKKLSLGKRKLALLDKKKGGKKVVAARPVSQHDVQHEPLLALS